MALWSIAEHQPTPASQTEFLLTIPGGGSDFPSSGIGPISTNFQTLISDFKQISVGLLLRSPLVGSQGHAAQPCIHPGETNEGNFRSELYFA